MGAVLVTGGAGFIGSHACKALAAAGQLPVTVDNFSTGHRWAVRYGPLYIGDIGDPQVVREAIRRHGIDAAIHFAAKAYVGESVQNPRKYFRENVGGSIRLLETLLDCGVRRVIFSSTCATYGLPQNLPIDETAPQHPVNPYGESKLFVEKMLRWYGEAYGLQWMALRYFNAAGADPDGDLGEEHDPETHLIPCAIEAALHRRPYLEVFGMDYETPDGTAIRDFTHVSDLARAHLLSLAYLRGGGQSGALNLGTGKGHSVLEVVQAVAATCGRKPPLRSRPRRAGDPAQLVSDPTQAEKALGWKAAFTDLRSIVGTAYRWHSGQGAAARSAAAN